MFADACEIWREEEKLKLWELKGELHRGKKEDVA